MLLSSAGKRAHASIVSDVVSVMAAPTRRTSTAEDDGPPRTVAPGAVGHHRGSEATHPRPHRGQDATLLPSTWPGPSHSWRGGAGDQRDLFEASHLRSTPSRAVRGEVQTLLLVAASYVSTMKPRPDYARSSSQRRTRRKIDPGSPPKDETAVNRAGFSVTTTTRTGLPPVGGYEMSLVRPIRNRFANLTYLSRSRPIKESRAVSAVRSRHPGQVGCENQGPDWGR